MWSGITAALKQLAVDVQSESAEWLSTVSGVAQSWAAAAASGDDFEVESNLPVWEDGSGFYGGDEGQSAASVAVLNHWMTVRMKLRCLRRIEHSRKTRNQQSCGSPHTSSPLLATSYTREMLVPDEMRSPLAELRLQGGAGAGTGTPDAAGDHTFCTPLTQEEWDRLRQYLFFSMPQSASLPPLPDEFHHTNNLLYCYGAGYWPWGQAWSGHQSEGVKETVVTEDQASAAAAPSGGAAAAHAHFLPPTPLQLERAEERQRLIQQHTLDCSELLRRQHDRLVGSLPPSSAADDAAAGPHLTSDMFFTRYFLRLFLLRRDQEEVMQAAVRTLDERLHSLAEEVASSPTSGGGSGKDPAALLCEEQRAEDDEEEVVRVAGSTLHGIVKGVHEVVEGIRTTTTAVVQQQSQSDTTTTTTATATAAAGGTLEDGARGASHRRSSSCPSEDDLFQK